MKDDQIVALMRSGKEDKALLRLYKYQSKVVSLIKSKGGSAQDGQDIFQEALLVFCGKIENPDFTLTAKIDTYLYGVSRLLWANALRKRGKMPAAETPLENINAQEIDEYLEKEEQYKRAENALADLGAKCWELLKLFYHQGVSMVEIAKKLGFKSDKIAKNQKYKCLEKAKLKYIELSNQA